MTSTITPKEFNDPDAWGFCRHCAFLVAVEDGKLWDHRWLGRQGGSDMDCAGIGLDPDEQPGPEAVPLWPVRQPVPVEEDV